MPLRTTVCRRSKSETREALRATQTHAQRCALGCPRKATSAKRCALRKPTSSAAHSADPETQLPRSAARYANPRPVLRTRLTPKRNFRKALRAMQTHAQCCALGCPRKATSAKRCALRKSTPSAAHSADLERQPRQALRATRTHNDTWTSHDNVFGVMGRFCCSGEVPPLFLDSAGLSDYVSFLEMC